MRRGWVTGSRGGQFRPVIGVVAVMAIVVTACLDGDRSSGGAAQLRAVRSSLAPGQRALTLSTTALYARNDPWKAYLASETTCPGGERTDLPVARQIETVACLVNYARNHRGLRALVIRPVLNNASIKKANDIVRCQTFAHNPCGRDWTSAVRSTGYAGEFGENLYIATGRWGAPRVAVDAWLNSPRHRENLFGRAWRDQGLALLSNESFGGYRNVSLWVNVLGER